jgi:Zn finger protein HypA/HybF involved in hydrogenase expression
MEFDQETQQYVLTEADKEQMFAEGWNKCEVCKQPYWFPRNKTKCNQCGGEDRSLTGIVPNKPEV